MTQFEEKPYDKDAALHQFLDMLERTQPSARVLAAIAVERLITNPTFQYKSVSLEGSLDDIELRDLQEYFAAIAEEHNLTPEHMSDAIRQVISESSK